MHLPGLQAAFPRPTGALGWARRRRLAGHVVEQQLDHVLVPVLQVACARCSTSSEVSLASDAVSAGSQQGQAGSIQGGGACSKCHQAS